MPQKNATPTREQAASLRRAGLNAWDWVVIKDLKLTLIVRNRCTGVVKLIDK